MTSFAFVFGAMPMAVTTHGGPEGQAAPPSRVEERILSQLAQRLGR